MNDERFDGYDGPPAPPDPTASPPPGVELEEGVAQQLKDWWEQQRKAVFRWGARRQTLLMCAAARLAAAEGGPESDGPGRLELMDHAKALEAWADSHPGTPNTTEDRLLTNTWRIYYARPSLAAFPTEATRVAVLSLFAAARRRLYFGHKRPDLIGRALADLRRPPWRWDAVGVGLDCAIRYNPSVYSLAFSIYQGRCFDRASMLADCLQAAGCKVARILRHLRDDKDHFRGCWALDAILECDPKRKGQAP